MPSGPHMPPARPDTQFNLVLISLPLFLSAWAYARLAELPRLGRCGASAILFGMVACSIGAGILAPSAATAASIVGNFAASAQFNLVYLQTQELYPTQVRNSALGVCSFAARLGSFAAAPMATIFGSTATLALICTMAATAAPLALCVVPETRGHELSHELPQSRGCAYPARVI